MLQTEKVCKSFGKTEILHDVDLNIKRGEVYGLVGQNGAGKTTLMRLISGLMKTTKGTIRLNTDKRYIGYMPQSCRFDDRSTVSETIKFFAGLRSSDNAKSLTLCDKLSLDKTKKVKNLSPGQQKKLQIILAMVGSPDFYILDEPTAGLDPEATFEMKNIIKKIHGEGKSILISSHILSDMDEICTGIAIMDKGRLTYNNELTSSYVLKTSPVTHEALQTLKKLFKVTSDEKGTTLTAEIDKKQVPELVKALGSLNISIFEAAASNVKNLVQREMHIGEEGQRQ